MTQPQGRDRRIAVVGAGFAGVAATKVLSRFGHDVTVFERCADVGGVWSAERRYPGLRAQNVKSRSRAAALREGHGGGVMCRSCGLVTLPGYGAG